MPETPRWAVALDFDWTSTSRNTPPLMPLVVDRSFRDAPLAEMLAWRNLYIERFESGRIRPQDYRDWLLGDIGLYVQHGLTRAQWQSALGDVPPRPGLLDCLRGLHAAQVPVCVVSAATADFIDYVFTCWGARHLLGAIYATWLKHDATGTVVGYDPASIVDSGNKGERCRHFADRHGIPHEGLIGVGDSIGDATLGHLPEHRIGVAESAAHAAALDGLGIMGEIVLVNDGFDPAAAAIHRRLGLRL